MKENKKVISRKTLADYIDQLTAQEFRIDESEISKMLDFFHRVGVLLYFDKDGLKENIILDIQWLLDAFKCIIQYPLQLEGNDMKRTHFKRTGELDNVELDRIWNVEGKDFRKHKTTIIAYMQQLGLLMPLKELHRTDSSGYYFPSMNSKRFDKTGEKHSKSSILCFKFDDKMQLPINVFYGIFLKCAKLNNWPISPEVKKDSFCLYQNAACFSFREHFVVLCNCNFEIRVQVWALPEIYDGRLLEKIKSSVEDIIRDDDLSYEIGYKCRKDVLTDEEDVSFIPQSIFPVSNYVCKTCDVDENHFVKNDIRWELEVNYENQEHGERYKKKDENKSLLKDPEPPIGQNDDIQKSKTIQREEKQNQESVYKIAMIDGKRQHNPEIDDDILIQFLSKGNISVYHVRFIIVGCGKAGKTTLLKRLQNVSFDELMQIERTEMVDSHSFEVLLEEETIQSVGGKNLLVENSSQKKIENIPRDVPKNPANNNNAENEGESICESQDKIFVQKQLYPNTNKTHDEDDKTHFQKYAISKIKDALNELLNEKKLRPRITFLDFPGQSMYYAFPQIYLRPESCPILVVDMTKSLNEKVDVKDKNEKECSQFTSWRYKDYYKFWLESIDTFVYSGSPVIIVGTHADKLSKEECRKFLKSLNELFDNWSHSGLRRHLNEDRMYTIGFPDSGSELEDLKDLKKCIANIVNCPRYSKENIRPVWALFEHILNKMKETEKVIPRKTLSDYSDQLSAEEFRIDESEISKMLVFFHRVGVLLYFDKDGLKEKIILDIQWLLDAFKCIIEYPVRPEENDMKRRHFCRTGELDSVELDRIWHIQGKDYLKHKTTIIAYMQQLGLLMQLKELHSIDSTVYYFPSMNSKRFDKTGENNSKSSILCFKFDDEMQLQINIFHGIVLKCSKLNNWSILTEGAKNNICLYQNAACFSFQKHVVVLCNCNFEIRVQVWASPNIYDGKLLKKIKHSVEDIIHDDDLSYEIGYKCRKDVLNIEEDVSFISQSMFPVSNHLCEICDIDKKHVVDNDICWELEMNDENQEKNTLPLSLEDYPCDKNNIISQWRGKDVLFGSRIGLQGTNTYGCVGFLVKSNVDSTVPVTGFLTTAHSVIKEYEELYDANCMLSEYKQKPHCMMAKEPQVVVQYTDLKFTTPEPVGEVVEAFCGNYVPPGSDCVFGMDAAFVKSFNPYMGEIRPISTADDSTLTFDGTTVVIKRNKLTGNTYGVLISDNLSAIVQSSEKLGGFFFFSNCFGVRSINEDRPFFREAESGSAVYVKGKNNILMPLGIAFACLPDGVTCVCRIDKIIQAFNVSIYQVEDEEDMETEEYS
nr:uncharacterized protein LOC105340271 isoform X1 [Crassostrea gigas]